MLSKIKDKNIWIVYGAILILGVAYGIAISLIAHHLDAHGFDKPQMGSLASWFALGIVALSLPMGWVIRRLSAKTTLVACLAGYSLTVSLFPALGAYPAIALDRFLDGAFSVGIWVSCETILLSRAERAMKAYVTSLYAVAVAIGYVVGPLAAEGIVRVSSSTKRFSFRAVWRRSRRSSSPPLSTPTGLSPRARRLPRAPSTGQAPRASPR